jgi:hypothetical protein
VPRPIRDGQSYCDGDFAIVPRIWQQRSGN